jgi:hypothetical protein
MVELNLDFFIRLRVYLIRHGDNFIGGMGIKFHNEELNNFLLTSYLLFGRSNEGRCHEQLMRISETNT